MEIPNVKHVPITPAEQCAMDLLIDCVEALANGVNIDAEFVARTQDIPNREDVLFHLLGLAGSAWVTLAKVVDIAPLVYVDACFMLRKSLATNESDVKE